MGENDILGRYGGEEIHVIFINQTIQEALAAVDKFHQAVQEREWDGGLKITMSCGVNEYVKGVSHAEFVDGADK